MFRSRSNYFRRHGAEIMAAGVLLLQAASPALAGEASKWDAGPHSAVRLLAGDSITEKGARLLRAGVEIKLAAGWKTYWRYPGDSGVPPRFDFSRSENVHSVIVKWPAPDRFSDESGVSIGYKGQVVFPLVVVPQDAGKPTVLRLDLDYAICEKLCMPAVAKAELPLAGSSPAQNAALNDAETRVPKLGAVGDKAPLAIRSVQRVSGAAEPRILVEVAVPDGASAVDLFAEGPTPEWALPVPVPVDGAPAGARRFAFSLAGLPAGASAAGATLKLTAVAGDQAVEVSYRLD
jgi:DsbC/DsbD-like thiol-disulfide interchange protein